MQNKHVVIAGGGFGGLSTAVFLARKNIENLQITLIDEKDYSLYYPILYEVACSDEELENQGDLKTCIALKFSEILPKNVTFVQGTVESVDSKSKILKVSGKDLNYDYLVLALGSMSDYFGIEGLEEYSLTLKSFPGAIKIRNAMQTLFAMHAEGQKPPIRIVIGGGGFSGVEMAGELMNLVEILRWKYDYPKDNVELQIIEGAPQLLPGLDREVAGTIHKRLSNMGVRISLGSRITKVEPAKLSLSTGETLNYDLLIWTGGVKSREVPILNYSDLEKDRKGRCQVDAQLTVCGGDIFMLGDNASIAGKEGFLPQTATQAMYQAEYIVDAIDKRLVGKQPSDFVPKEFPYIIPIRGKWAAWHDPHGFTSYGLTGWLAHRAADVRYFAKFLPYPKAFHLVWFGARLYSRND